MKRFICLLVVLCVVAPSYGIALVEYTWNAGATPGNFTDTTWSVVVAGVTQTTYPAYPFEATNNATDYTAYSRPQIAGTGNDLTVNTDVGPTNVGFQQLQLDQGSLTVDAGGKLVIGQGYMTCGAKNSDGTGGLFVQNGGQYINLATNAASNQAGTLLGYSTTGSIGRVTISGAGSVFDTQLFLATRYTQNQVKGGQVNVLGSGSTINVGSYNPGGNNTTVTFKFATDAAGVSPINIATSLAFNKGVGNVANTNNVSILDFVLGAAPAASYTLFDLAEGAVSTGKLQLVNGRVLQEQHLLLAEWEGGEYFYAISYVGGETGNDITLTQVPEPATMALLSLGGLFLARRRRA